jgi:hypothetical protein
MKYLYIFAIIVLLINIILSVYTNNWPSFFGWITALVWCINSFILNKINDDLYK